MVRQNLFSKSPIKNPEITTPGLIPEKVHRYVGGRRRALGPQSTDKARIFHSHTRHRKKLKKTLLCDGMQKFLKIQYRTGTKSHHIDVAQKRVASMRNKNFFCYWYLTELVWCGIIEVRAFTTKQEGANKKKA